MEKILNPLRGEVCKAIFDASLYKTRLNQTAGEDLIATSSNNYYEGVTQEMCIRDRSGSGYISSTEGISTKSAPARSSRRASASGVRG